jgi:hypothetical protein
MAGRKATGISGDLLLVFIALPPFWAESDGPRCLGQGCQDAIIFAWKEIVNQWEDQQYTGSASYRGKRRQGHSWSGLRVFARQPAANGGPNSLCILEFVVDSKEIKGLQHSHPLLLLQSRAKRTIFAGIKR